MLLPKNNSRTFLIKLLTVLLMTAGVSPLRAENMLVYCMCNPRSSLVELLRSVGQREDFKIMHIPGNWAYCHEHNFLKQTEGWYRQGAPATYIKAKEDILKEVVSKNVFVGENTHTAKDFFEQNPDFLQDSRLKLVFLVSNPHSAIISYYRKKQEYNMFDSLPTTQIGESMGLKGMYELLMDIKKRGGKAPHVIKSEDLFFKTRETLESLCAFLAIPFKEEMLQWRDMSANFRSFEDWGWYTIELTDCSKTWHGKAIQSTGFTMPEIFRVDAQDNPTFSEIDNPRHRDICIQAYKENLVYYQLLFGK